MKLIIDIPDDVYEDIEHCKGDYINYYINSLNWAVRNGTPYEERPQGEWIDICTLPIIRKCSICGNKIGNEMGFYNNFCPNCGAEMQKGSKE